MSAFESMRASFNGVPVCVTGGAGFIGSHLVDALVDLGANVRVIDDLSNGRAENLEKVRARITFIEDSILENDSLRRAVDGCRFVFHEAALGSVPQSVREPLRYHEVNSTGTVRVLEAARTAGTARVIYASSSSVYGESEELPKRESMRPDPVSPYAASKLMGEYWSRAYSHCYGLSTASLRYFNVFGPRQRPDSQYAAVVPAFAAALRAGRRPVIYGDGLQSRDFTHVDNVVAANLRAAACSADLCGDAFNIACGERSTLLELLGAMSSAIGAAPTPGPDHQPARAGDVRHSQADITLASQRIGFRPHVGLQQGLSAMFGGG